MIPGMRRKYLRIRSEILQNRYNVNFDIQSNSACSQSTSLVNTQIYIQFIGFTKKCVYS